MADVQNLEIYQSTIRRSFYRQTLFWLWFVLGRPLLASWLPGTLWRKLLLCSFGAKIAQGGRLKPRLHVTAPWNLVIGCHCWLGEDVWIDNLDSVVLGDHVCISQSAYLCTGNHDFRRTAFDLRLAPIMIGSESWIAARATIAPGVHVGARSVIGLGAVLTTNVPPGVIVKGNPAVVVGPR